MNGMGQQIERKFVNEYIKSKLWGKHYQTRVWLGTFPPGPDMQAFHLVGRWADIVTFEPDIVTIIEAKLEPDPKAIGQLLQYKNMFAETPRFHMYANWQVNLLFLTSRVDTHVQELCEQQGIAYEVFRPEWIPSYEKQRFHT